MHFSIRMMLFSLIFLISLFSLSVSDPRISQAGLVCGDTKLPPSDIIPNFGQVMVAISKSVVQQGWGYANVSKSPKIFGLFECYTDVQQDDCLSCYAESRTKLPVCLPANSARIYLDGCFLRYDNYSFFNESIDPNRDTVKCSEPAGVFKDQDMRLEFEKRVNAVIDNVTKIAVKKKGFGVAGVEGGDVVAYALAQCWKTVDEKGCRDCLANAESAVRRCLPSSEGRALNAGCYLRYSNEKFYNEGTAKKKGNGKIPSIHCVCLHCILRNFQVYDPLCAVRAYSPIRPLICIYLVKKSSYLYNIMNFLPYLMRDVTNTLEEFTLDLCRYNVLVMTNTPHPMQTLLCYVTTPPTYAGIMSSL